MAQSKEDRKAWLKRRQKSIGSSDAPIIMGVSPWRNLLQLYHDKTCEEITEDTTNQYAKDRGNEIEPKVRELWEKKTGNKYQPKTVVMEEVPHLAANLDGITDDDDKIIEIKFSNLFDWAHSTDKQIVPKKYLPQIQHQLMVTGASVCFYLSYPYSKEAEEVIDEKKLAVIAVIPDFEYQKLLRKACDDFWFNHVVPRIPPVIAPPHAVLEDESPMWGSNVKSLAEVAKEWARLTKEIRELEAKQEACRSTLIDAATKTQFNKLVCGGVRLAKQTRAGNIDYSRIEALRGIDLELYRKEPTTYWKLELDKP